MLFHHLHHLLHLLILSRWKSQSPHKEATFCFETGSFSRLWDLPIRLGSLAIKLQGTSCLHLSSTGMTSVNHCAQFVMWVRYIDIDIDRLVDCDNEKKDEVKQIAQPIKYLPCKNPHKTARCVGTGLSSWHSGGREGRILASSRSTMATL